MSRSAAAILKDNALALIKRQREGRTYCVFPGRDVERGESPNRADIREVRTESGLEAAIERLIAKMLYTRAGRGHMHQFYFPAHLIGGQLDTGQVPGLCGLYPPRSDTYTQVWLPLVDAVHEIVHTVPITEMIYCSTTEGWLDKVIRLQEEA
jgi:8-oxo-dGTP diphosphatase